jgi:hypothetical protein
LASVSPDVCRIEIELSRIEARCSCRWNAP